jgi:hypothetical protein
LGQLLKKSDRHSRLYLQVLRVTLRKLSIVAPVLICLILSACQKDPSPNGVNLLPGGDLINVRVFDSQRDSTPVTTSSYTHLLTPAATTILSLGASDGYQSSILIRWLVLPDSVANGGTILSAKLTLHPLQYHIGDPAIPLSFDVREIMKPWSSFSFTRDSLSQLQQNAPVVGSFRKTVDDTSAIDISLDTTMVRKWFNNISSQQNYNIYGVLLDPTGAPNCLRAFQASAGTNPPKLTVLYQKGSTVDTIIASGLENTYIASGPSVAGTSLSIHGGIAYRGKVRFDLSAIPVGSIINNVQIFFTRDSLKSKTYYHGYDTLVLYQCMDSVANTPSYTYTYTYTDHSTGKIVGQGYNLIRAVQQWVNNPAQNMGLLIIKGGELSDLDLLSLRGTDEGVALRPRFVVTYTLRK